MKKILSFLLLATILFTLSKAQTAVEQDVHFNFKEANTSLLASNASYTGKYSLAYYQKDKAYYEKKVAKYKKMKTIGIVLSSLGGAALAGTIAGTVVLSRKADWNDGYTSGGTTYYDGNTGAAKALGMAIGGTFLTAGLLGPGIPLAVIGASKSKKYSAKLSGL